MYTERNQADQVVIDQEEKSLPNVSQLPLIILSLILGTLIILINPWLLQRIFWLEFVESPWRFLIFGIQAFAALILVAAWLVRKQFRQCFSRVFPTPRTFVFSLVSIFFGLFISLLLLEIALRIVGLPFKDAYTPTEQALGQFDPDLGWSYIPIQSNTEQFGTAQREIPMHFNDIGARVGAPNVSHDPTAPTVFFIGGSFTFGQGVLHEETFAGQLEANPVFPFQAINLGVQGYGTDQSLLRLQRYFHDYNVKAVVYTYIDDHMIRNASYDRREIVPTARMVGTKPSG